MTSTKPIVFQDTLKVEAGATLTIPAGTTVYFSQKAALDVYGTLRCEGTADNPVTLRGDRLDKMFKYLPYDRVSGQWQEYAFTRTVTIMFLRIRISIQPIMVFSAIVQ